MAWLVTFTLAEHISVQEKREASPYCGWFQNLNFGGSSPMGDPFWYEGWSGHYDLVKLNLRNPEVTSHLLGAIGMWMDEFGIDGLRLDVAYMLNEDFMRRLRAYCDGKKPEFVLIGEMIHGDYNRITADGLLHSVTNYECYKGLYSAFNSMNLFEIAHSLGRQFGPEPWTLYRGKHLMNFADNHDVTRIASILNDEKQIYPLYGVLFAMPGIPCLYYGSEWGAALAVLAAFGTVAFAVATFVGRWKFVPPAEHRPAITYIAYPNNPTATLWDDTAVLRTIDAAGAQGGIVVIDEAYQPFASRTWLDRMRAEPARHGHVLLMRTLSKFGLAGVRLGYLMGPAALVHEIDKVRPPYNVSVLNGEAALFALEHADVFAAQAAELRAGRDLLVAQLRALPGVLKVWDSEANMVLLRVPDAARTFEGMKNRKVLVKNVSTMHPLLAGCLRLTVGSAADNAQMLAALQASL